MRKKVLVILVCALAACIMVSGCSANDSRKSTASEGAGETLLDESAQGTKTPENCIVIETKYGNLYYPDQWTEHVQIDQVELENGIEVSFMFGTLDITYYATVQGMTAEVIQARADMGGWAGDIADMMYCAVNVDIADKVDITETDVDVLADAIRTRYLGADYATLNSVDHSFTSTDVYGDMDAFYVASMLSSGDSISSILENYFSTSLSDESRAAYFLQNRLGGMQTKAGIRNAVLSIRLPSPPHF